MKALRKIVVLSMGKRPTSHAPRHRRDPHAVRTHPWIELRQQRILELGQYR